ncbi:MAG: hypothetical protein IPM24_11320 [Bryobacterales bacterium]|nr:hypothetical protein [Bryobacterales bacterium]
MQSGEGGLSHGLSRRALDRILWRVPRTRDGRLRLLASLALPGRPAGPFRYRGTRSDDPNDLIPHEDRRDLRGLHVFCAWLNHTDAKSINSLDILVEEDCRRFVRHYLIDFGAAFGSDSDMLKNPRYGHAFILPDGGEVWRGILNLGLVAVPWERARYPKLRAVGRFGAEAFDPETWVPNYPNPAFARRQPEDEYWAAKIVMAFSDAEIRAIVDTGQFSDPRAAAWIAETLIARRDIVGRAYFTKVPALDRFRVERFRVERFRVEDEALRFDDLAVTHGFVQPRQYEIAWFRFDNATRELTLLPGETEARIPKAGPGGYVAARLRVPDQPEKAVLVYLRRSGQGFEVVGVERISSV